MIHERSRARKRPTDRRSPAKPKRRRSRTRSVYDNCVIRPTNEDDIEIDQDVTTRPTTGSCSRIGVVPVLDNFNPVQLGFDHHYSKEQPSSSEKSTGLPTFEEVAHNLFRQNLLVQFDHENITVVIHKDVVCTVDRVFNMNIEVCGQKIKDDHVVWCHIPKIWDPAVHDYVSHFKLLKEQWRACKCSVNAYAASEFVSKLGTNGINCDAATNIISHAINCIRLCRQETCIACKKGMTVRAKKEVRQKKQAKFGNKNIRYLSRTEALECVRTARHSLHLEKRKTCRLRKKLHALIQKRGVNVMDSDNIDFCNILQTSSLSNRDLDESKTEEMPLNKIDMTALFFEEQLKAAKVKSTKGHRWHPLMLKWCLYLKTKSSSTYCALRKVITLPSEKRLYQIQDHTHIKPGFQDDVLSSLEKEFLDAGPENHKRYCTLMFDEMKIQEDLVYKTSTNELIGFVRLSDIDQLIGEIDSEINGRRNEEILATHVLQLMVRGITSSILTTFAYFATKTLTSKNLYTIMWEAVEILESKDIRVIAFVADGASPNRMFFKMCSGTNDSQAWFTKNPYARHRNIYFVSDVPHLMKTTRNCFSNSGAHSKSRLLWRNNKNIEWNHVVKAYKRDLSNGIRQLSHITDEHVHLTPCSRMKVKLAVQILSRKMSIAVKNLKSGDMTETITFLEIFNKWFDLLNVRHVQEAKTTRNDNLKAYTKQDDNRLTWLTGDFIKYLDNWEREVTDRPGNFTKTQRGKMMLSRETIDGLKITSRSIPALVKFMLDEGAQFVLSYKFNQDPVELEFSKQRGAAGCNTNPNLMRFGDNSAKLKSMRMAKQELTYSGKGNITN